MPVKQEADWAIRPVWAGETFIAFPGIQTPDLPASSIFTVPTMLFQIKAVLGYF